MHLISHVTKLQMRKCTVHLTSRAETYKWVSVHWQLQEKCFAAAFPTSDAPSIMKITSCFLFFYVFRSSFIKSVNWGWRDESADKNEYCSCRGLFFSSQLSYWVAKKPHHSRFWALSSFALFSSCNHAYVHTQAHMHKHN